MERPFVDYYERLGRTPVAQDISDLERHFERRTALYRLLGIPPRFFELAEVLEFGPGTGHNAVHIAHFGPKRYVLVDASSSSLAALAETLRAHFGSLDRFEIVRSLVEEYRSERQFDIVLAENMIPLQRDPKDFVRHIGAHVRPGGVLVVTCTDAVSFVGEMMRRLIAMRVAPPPLEVEERVARLEGLFAEHLAQMPGVTRSSADWTRDNVTHPLDGAWFSIEDAIVALDDAFDVYAGSPHFLTDWRWYKQLYGAQRLFNQRGVRAYRENLVNLLDWRITIPPQDESVGAAIAAMCQDVWVRLRAAEEGREAFDSAGFARRVEALAARLPEQAALTARSLRALASYLRAPEGAEPRAYLADFAAHFGRGAQFVSFVRR